jgi:hypothetical protein
MKNQEYFPKVMLLVNTQITIIGFTMYFYM